MTCLPPVPTAFLHSHYMLIDIQAKMRQANSPWLECWAKIFSLKDMAKTVMYLQKNGLTDFGELEKACNADANNSTVYLTGQKLAAQE